MDNFTLLYLLFLYCSLFLFLLLSAYFSLLLSLPDLNRSRLKLDLHRNSLQCVDIGITWQTALHWAQFELNEWSIIFGMTHAMYIRWEHVLYVLCDNISCIKKSMAELHQPENKIGKTKYVPWATIHRLYDARYKNATKILNIWGRQLKFDYRNAVENTMSISKHHRHRMTPKYSHRFKETGYFRAFFM